MYKAILFSPDGDWVTDCSGQTKEEVWNKIADLGSRWYFYPYPAIIKDKGHTNSFQRICDVYAEPDSLQEWMKGKSIRTIQAYLSQNPLVN